MSLEKNIEICESIEKYLLNFKDNLFEIIILQKSTHSSAKKEIKILEKENSILLKNIKNNFKQLKLEKKMKGDTTTIKN